MSCRQIEIRSWFELRNVLDDNRQSHPELDRSSCFHESIHSVEMIDHFQARCTLDMSFQSVKFCIIKCREVVSSFNSLRETCIGAEFGQLKVFWNICELLLVFTQQISLYSCIGGRNLICCRHLWWHYMVFRLSSATGFTVLFEHLESSQANSSHISASAPWTLTWLTEMIARRNTSAVSSSPQKCIDNFPSALHISSFKSTGSTKKGMSAFTEINHHDIRDTIPCSIRFVCVSSVPFLLWSRPKKRPMSLRECSSIFCTDERIRNTNFSVSFFSPYNVVKHWHEDNKSLEMLRFTPYFTHHILNLSEDPQWSESRESFPLELHRLPVDSVQFSVLTWIHKPINLLLPCFDGIWTESSHTRYGIGEEVGFLQSQTELPCYPAKLTFTT